MGHYPKSAGVICIPSDRPPRIAWDIVGGGRAGAIKNGLPLALGAVAALAVVGSCVGAARPR